MLSKKWGPLLTKRFQLSSVLRVFISFSTPDGLYRLHLPGLKSIAVNAIYLSSARAVTSLARGLYAVALAKLLGAELYGLLNYGLSWYILFVPISVLGLNEILIREIGRDHSQAPKLVGQTLALRTVSSFIVALLSIALAWFVESDPTPRLLLFIFSAALFGRSLSLWVNAVFQAHEASGFVLVQEVVFRLLEVGVGMVLLLQGYGIVAIAMVHAASWLLQGAIGLGVIRRHLLEVQMIWDTSALFSLIKRGAPFVISGLLFGWLLQGPILMYRHLEGISGNLGQLALALQALFIIGAIISELRAAALPVLARSVDRGDGKSDHYVDFVLRGGFLMGGALAIGAIAIGHWLVDFLFGPSYALTATLLPWTLLMVAPYFWVNALSSMIIAHGRYGMVMINNAVGALIFTIAFLLLVSEMDLLGVVLALALGLTASVVGQLITLQRYHAGAFVNVIIRTLIAVTGALLVTYLALSFSQWVALVAGIAALIGFSFTLGVVRVGEIRMAHDFARTMMKKSKS